MNWNSFGHPSHLVLLGRAIFDAYLAPGHQIHDLYVFTMGSFVIVLAILLTVGMARGTSAILKRHDYGGYASLLRCFWIHVRQKALSVSQISRKRGK
jgi:hypothetical protein